MKIQGHSMKMTRGDTEALTVTLTSENGVNIPLVEEDLVIFTVKETPTSITNAIQIIVNTFENGKAIISILPEHTSNLRFGDYRYDIELRRADKTVRTIIPDSKFTIGAEITTGGAV